MIRADLGALAGQGAGLVEEDGIDLVHQFQRPAVLDQNPLVGAEGQRREHGQRRGHPDAGAEVAVEHRHRAERAHRRQARLRRWPGSGSRPCRPAASPLCCELSLYPAESLRIWLILAEAVSLPDFSTETKTLPATIRVEANTRSPTPFSAGVDSPVRACWSIIAIPSTTTPSTGTTSPVLTTMMSPWPEPVHRDLDLDPVAVQPDIPRLLAEGVEQELLGVVLRPLDQDPAEARHQQSTAPGKIDIVPRQPTTTIASSTSTPSRRSSKRTCLRLLERRDRRVGEHHGGDRQEGREGELCDAASGSDAVQMPAGGGRACRASSGARPSPGPSR